jgi:hypothetical protein
MKLSWKKLTINSLINTKKNNNNTINDLLEILDKVLCIFNNMKLESILLEQSLIKLKTTCDEEGKVSEISISTYNLLICQFINSLKIFLNLKITSSCGNSFMINPVCNNNNEDDNENNYMSHLSLSFKLQENNLINCEKICTIDNITIPSCSPHTTENNTQLTIEIGYYKIIIKLVNNTEYSYSGFCELLCEGTPHSLHLFIAHLNKNIIMIEKSILYIYNIVKIFNLY